MTWDILHCFADEGIESEVLAAYGEVTRVGLDPKGNQFTTRLIKADVKELELDQEFDLGLFHPPCQSWAKQTHIHGDRESHENLIPLARDVANQYCKHYIIENVPGAPLKDPIRLNGGMFGSPLHYERCFETNYHVEQPRNQSRLCGGHEGFENHHETGGWKGSKELWKSVKGYTGDYDSRSLKREAIPRAYINYLVRPLL